MGIARLNTIRVPAGWLAMVVLLLCGIANARTVFDAPGRVISPVEAQRVESDPLMVPGRYRLARLDRDGILSSIDQDLPLVFNLFNDIEARGQARSRKRIEGGSTFVSGTLEDGGHFTLFLHHNGVIRGEIHSAKGFYSLKSEAGDRSQVLIQQKDLSLLPGCGLSHEEGNISVHGKKASGLSVPAGASQPHSRSFHHSREGEIQTVISGKSATSQGAGSDTIDILVLYTQRVEDYEGGPAQITAVIENEIEKMNHVLENSDLSHRRVKLARMEKVNYEQGSLHDDYQNLSKTKEDSDNDNDPDNDYSPLDEVFPLIKKYQADLVHLLVRDLESICGVASVYGLRREYWHGKLCEGSANYSLCVSQKRRERWKTHDIFAVSVVKCLNSYVFAHETGHNLSLLHNRENYEFEEDDFIRNGPFKNYAFGFIDPNSSDSSQGCRGQMTVMATNDNKKCGNSNKLIRVPYFSNPELDFPPPRDPNYYPFQPHTPMGVPGDERTHEPDGPVNASRTIDEVWDIVASLSDVETPPVNVSPCNEGDIPSTALSLGAQTEMPAEGGTETFRISFPVPDNCAGVSLEAVSSSGAFSAAVEKIEEGEFELSVKAESNSDSCDARKAEVTVFLKGIAGVSPAHTSIIQASNNELCSSLSSLPADTTSLNLSGKNTSPKLRLTSGVLSRFTQLEGLNLSRNLLASLPESIFSDNRGLTELWLHANKFTAVPEHTFAGLDELQILNLSENGLTDLPDDIFSGLNNLQHLWLWRNQLPWLSPNWFADLTRLKTLSLSDNELEYLDDAVFSNLGRLEELWLLNNDVYELSNQSLTGLSSLRSLSLSGNQLTTLGDGVFSDLANLESLWLQNNDIADIDPGAFSGLSNLSFLDLSGNPLAQALPKPVCTFLRSVEELQMDGISMDVICSP